MGLGEGQGDPEEPDEREDEEGAEPLEDSLAARAAEEGEEPEDEQEEDHDLDGVLPAVEQAQELAKQGLSSGERMLHGDVGGALLQFHAGFRRKRAHNNPSPSG